MSLEKLADRPLMGSLDPQLDVVEKPPTSYLAVAAFVLGILSLFSTFGSALLPLPILAIAFGLLVYWKLKNESVSGGTNFALLGFGLGIFFLVWSLTATRLRNEYMYAAGGQFAKHFLDMLSAGKRYEAFELTRSESQRQIAGTSLEKYYQSQSSTNMELKESLNGFMSGSKMGLIESRGKTAAWETLRGSGVTIGSTGNAQVSVLMIEKSKEPHAQVRVQLERNDKSVPATANETTATWMVQIFGD